MTTTSEALFTLDKAVKQILTVVSETIPVNSLEVAFTDPCAYLYAAQKDDKVSLARAFASLSFSNDWRESACRRDGRSIAMYKNHLASELEKHYGEVTDRWPVPTTGAAFEIMDPKDGVYACPAQSLMWLANVVLCREVKQGKLALVLTQYNSIGAMYDAALSTPARFLSVLKAVRAVPGGVFGQAEEDVLRAWMTVKFFFSWRLDPNAHYGVSKQAYRQFLGDELAAVDEAVAKYLDMARRALAMTAETSPDRSTAPTTVVKRRVVVEPVATRTRGAKTKLDMSGPRPATTGS